VATAVDLIIAFEAAKANLDRAFGAWDAASDRYDLAEQTLRDHLKMIDTPLICTTDRTRIYRVRKGDVISLPVEYAHDSQLLPRATLDSDDLLESLATSFASCDTHQN
jgi:hypothetical protein